MKLVKYEIPDSAKTYKPAEPFLATVLENQRVTEAGAAAEIHNIVLDLSGSGIAYIEGQSVGIIPPGTQEDGRPHRVRLYSIASSRTGDDGTSSSVTLCVKRVIVQDENGNTVHGLASNYLCDLQPGQTVALMGPTGRTFFLPQDDTVDLILVAAGTGIAPFRAFIHRVYRERQGWKGKVRLFYGARTGMDSAYFNRANDDIGQYMSQETFEAFQAFSETPAKTENKAFVQDHLRANQEAVWQTIRQGNFSFYLCGMKAMEEGVNHVFAELAVRDGLDWDSLKAEFKKDGRWNVETY